MLLTIARNRKASTVVLAHISCDHEVEEFGDRYGWGTRCEGCGEVFSYEFDREAYEARCSAEQE